MTIICSGSLAFDRLMSYGAVFADSIIADKLNMLNVSYVTDELRLVHGGTAGNIAYNLALLGEKPLIAGCLGDDPDGVDYLRRLGALGLPLEAIQVYPGQATAGCTIATDRNNNQFTFFHPGAMALPCGFEPAELPQPFSQHLAIVSAGGFNDMKNLCATYRRLGLKFIFDPSQQVHVFSKEELIGMLDGSSFLVCNEYEFELVKKITELTTEALFQYTEVIIVTKGEKGSEIMVPGRGSQHVPAVPAQRVVNPTGAGDAFRAGLIKGLVMNEPVVTACRLGSTVAAFCVEVQGTQDQNYSISEVISRHASAFKEHLVF